MLELHDHENATFTTLTYDDKKLPVTLRPRDLQLFLKRLRKQFKKCGKCTECRKDEECTRNKIRFFASGEYGEQNNRPHYHAILYGLSEMHAEFINQTWGNGHTKSVAVTPAAIAYTAGYTAKKIGFRQEAGIERMDPETGELYNWQPPFITMSKKPGIGGTARQYTESWRDFAILNGGKQPVPRYYHEAWKKTATEEQQQQLKNEQQTRRLTKEQITMKMLEAQEQIEKAKSKLQAARRHL